MKQYMIYNWHKREYLTQVFTNSIRAQQQADNFNLAFPTGTAQPQFTVIVLQQY